MKVIGHQAVGENLYQFPSGLIGRKPPGEFLIKDPIVVHGFKKALVILPGEENFSPLYSSIVDMINIASFQNYFSSRHGETIITTTSRPLSTPEVDTIEPKNQPVSTPEVDKMGSKFFELLTAIF
jgi:hypothetical protein